jgi:heme-degrading monooxygenase HmoA
VRIHWTPPSERAAENTLAEAEIHFDADGPLAGMKLVGVAVRQGEREPYVTFPARAYDVGAQRGYLDYLCTVDHKTTVEGRRTFFRVRTWIMDSYRAWEQTRPEKEAHELDKAGRSSVDGR